MKLRPYQNESIEFLRNSFRKINVLSFAFQLVQEKPLHFQK